MSDGEDSSTLGFTLLVLAYLGLVPLGIWQALTFPNVTGLVLAAPFAALLAWAALRVVRDPVPRRS